MHNENHTHPQPTFALLSGIVGLAGFLAVIIADIVASVIVNHYSPISQTISDLAAGQRSWILDMGLRAMAAGVIVCAAGLYLWNLEGRRWKTGSILLLIIGVDIFIIATRDIYGDGAPFGVEIHIYLVYFLAFAFALTAWLLASGLREVDSFWFRFSRSTAVLWIVLAIGFRMAPTAWDGIYERILAVIMLIWLGSMCWLLMRQRLSTPVDEMG